MSSTSTRKTLRALAEARRGVLVPGAFNALSARVIEDLGFEAIYVTGAGVTNMWFGLPDQGFMGLAEIADHTARIRDAVGLPLIVDADTGFGNALNVRHTVRTLERAGADCIQFEDQVAPKRCGHFAGKDVISTEEAVAKIKAAVDARQDAQLMIMARTDACATQGFEAAVERAQRFAEAGADILFVEAPESEEEFKRVGAELAGSAKLLANMVPTGRSPVVSAEKLKSFGFSIAIYPSAGMGAACFALESAFTYLKKHQTLEGSTVPAYDMQQLHELVGFQDVWDFEKKHVET